MALETLFPTKEEEDGKASIMSSPEGVEDEEK